MYDKLPEVLELFGETWSLPSMSKTVEFEVGSVLMIGWVDFEGEFADGFAAVLTVVTAPTCGEPSIVIMLPNIIEDCCEQESWAKPHSLNYLGLPYEIAYFMLSAGELLTLYGSR